MSCISWCNYTGKIRPDKEPDSQLSRWEVILATLSNYGTNQLLKTFDADVSNLDVPTQFYVQACSTLCTRALVGTPITSYARVPITFTRVSDIQRWNPTTVYGGTASGDIDILSYALYDAAVDGNYWAYGNLAAQYTLSAGQVLTFEATKVSIGIGTCL